MSVERTVAQHYTHGALEQTILDALTAAGKSVDRLTPDDLAPIDEFHIGGRQATIDLMAQLPISPGAHLLDIGCGLGGASRYVAATFDARVTGIDLTEEYIRVAEAFAARLGLASRVSYRAGSALALPFDASTFDGAYMLHVGMNIADKRALFREVRRVLRPGGFLAVYDVMREAEGDLAFPVPWAATPETSFVETAAAYREHLAGAGFEPRAERSRRDFAIAFFKDMQARFAADGPPALGLPLLMGATSPQKIANMMENIQRGRIAPTEIISTAR